MKLEDLCANCGEDVLLHDDGDCPDGAGIGFLPVAEEDLING